MTAEDGLPSETGPATWSTWDRSGTAEDVRTLRPQTVEQLSEAMAAAAAAGLSTRVTGAGHSFNLLAQPQELRLDTSELVGLQEVDRQGRRATLLGGTPLIQAAQNAGPDVRELFVVSGNQALGLVSIQTLGDALGAADRVRRPSA